MKKTIALIALFLTAPVMAQTAPVLRPPPPDEGGLTGSVSDEKEWQDLGIAIPGFATDNNVAVNNILENLI